MTEEGIIAVLMQMEAKGAVLEWRVAMPKGRTRYIIRDATGRQRQYAPGEAAAFCCGFLAIHEVTANWTRQLPLEERLASHRRRL